jgi:hypothetical protein
MDQEQKLPPSPEELRRVARFVEETALEALDDYAAVPVPLAVGGPKEFPRPSPDDQAAEQGSNALRESAERAVIQLDALAFALQHGLEVPPVLFVPVQGYIDAFTAERGSVPGQEAQEPEAEPNSSENSGE